MAVKTVLRMGHPVLQKIADPVTEFNTPELDGLIQDMFDTMSALDGAGLAAPQIGVSLRVVIFGVKQNPRYLDAETVPQTILVNPQIEPFGEVIQEDWEGCLSLPDFTVEVDRARVVHVQFANGHAVGPCRPLAFEALLTRHRRTVRAGRCWPTTSSSPRLVSAHWWC